jgi:hypothetical protein
MPDDGGPLEIDRQLAEAIGELGEHVSPWQVKRWRESGLLRTHRPGLGRGRGSAPANFPPGVADHAACLARSLARRRSLDEACLGCFYRGFTPRERALKAAYQRQYQALTEWLERAGKSEDPWEAAELIARKLARRSGTHSGMEAARKRLRAAGKGSLFQDVIVNVLALTLGSPGQLRPEALLAFGAEGLTAPLGPGGALANSDDLRLDWLSLPALAETASEALLNDLEQARDTTRFVLSYGLDFASLVERTRRINLTALRDLLPDDSGCALLLVPATILLRDRIGSNTFEANVNQLREQHPRLEAINRLLDQLSPDLHPLVGQAAISIATISDNDRQRLVDEVRAYLEHHPEDIPLLTEGEQ